MFINEWKSFLSNAQDLCEHRLTFSDRNNYGAIKGLLNDVIKDLQNAEAISAVKQAVDTSDQDVEEKQINGYIERELIFFNNLIAESKIADVIQFDKNDTDDAINAGKTIKDSFEKQIKSLPKRVQKWLMILNEIFSIVKGGS